MTTTLPRLLYIGEVPVEAALGGSALLYRLLFEYPRDRLIIAQSREGDGFERLAGVPYKIIKPMKFLPNRWSGLRAVMSVIRGHIAAASIGAQFAAFRPQAVMTVTHGGEWITAWCVARHLGLPLHLICHDDWEHFLPVSSLLRGWTRRIFGKVYRNAVSRLCVSSYMEVYYQRQFGAPGTLLLPSRAKDVISPDGLPEPRASNSFTMAYAGSLHAAFAPALCTLAKALDTVGGRLVIFSKLSASSARELGLIARNIDIESVLPPAALVQRLRGEADALFLVMTDIGLGSRICFPSKLVDYTATALPIIVSAPLESAPAYWVRDNPSVAMLVKEGDDKALNAAIVALANDPARRRVLGSQAKQVGDAQFAYTRARDIFFGALRQQY